MRNRFPGQCYRCGLNVEAGKGHFERVADKNLAKLNAPMTRFAWLVQHAECAIKYRGTSTSIWNKENSNV